MHALSCIRVHTRCKSPKTNPNPGSGAVKASMQKENESAGTSFSPEAVCKYVFVCVHVCVGKGGGRQGEGEFGGSKCHINLWCVLFLKEANPTAT